ncbi:hypothetical protein [Alteromonas halophila]|uniref:Uncharacterized protein n=1 Tax=Alteromonas halophila TaxID=516698 RepID=A0A918JPG3_9ALTE|nr:hypothetical protein [Alteromonas halophila]GGW92188.1 hypothetical protein GCM10007391_28120 [Alteromonas halophila]
MLRFNIVRRHWLPIIAPLLGFYLVLQTAASIGQIAAGWFATHRALDNIERRVSLDQAYVDIGNAALGTPVNKSAVERYISRVNMALSDMHYPARILRIQDVTGNSDASRFSVSHSLVLTTSEQQITIVASARPLSAYLSLSVTALLITALALPLRIYSYRRTRQRARHQASSDMPATPKLVINLKDKTLGNGVDDTQVVLQNKPLCFYTALLKYCIGNPGAPLQHHQQVPEELLTLANRVFSRLIELGHTKRKRPDFNANLDKTLSEIRAALDEVFFTFNEEKELYYPPRAQGEGSRSKQHSYALPVLHEEDIEIIGN